MLNSQSKPKILMLMSGSIACYKACGLISMMTKAGYEVKVAASSSALKFIGSATIEGLTGEAVYSDLWEKGSAMEHIHLERWADLIIAAPASAHLINRMAHGNGDDLLTTLFLAHQFKKPFLIAPAMNTAMYLNPVTQNSIGILKGMGIKILESASGVLACGEVGYGRLLEPELLFQEVQNYLKSDISISRQPSKTNAELEKGIKSVLVTAGGTREPIDDVRYLTNKSTGITGEKIANTLSALGYDVTLDLAESASVTPSEAYNLRKFDSFSSLSNLLKSQLMEKDYDLVIHTAAVSDFTVDKSEGKISSSEEISLKLKKNPKIVNALKDWSRNKEIKVVAFKLTSNATDEQIKNKVSKVMEESHADAVIQNDISSTNNRNKHQFKIFTKKSTAQAIGVEELISGFVKEGIL